MEAGLNRGDLTEAEWRVLKGLLPISHQELIRWSVQEVRRIANKLAQRRIKPAYVIAWSCWRRAHQAAARCAHLKLNMQL